MTEQKDLKSILEAMQIEMDINGYLSTNDADYLIENCRKLIEENEYLRKIKDRYRK